MATTSTTTPPATNGALPSPQPSTDEKTAVAVEKINPLDPTTADDVTKMLGGPWPLKRSFAQVFWPPHGLDQGLYRTALTACTKNKYKFYITASIYNTCLILQLVLGAVLTGLGASSAGSNHTAITILAAANTVNAGLVALLHNSGLPARIRNDWVEYQKVVLWLEEVMRGGYGVGVAAPNGAVVGKDEVSREGWARFERARATVEGNRPNNYIGTPTGAGGVVSAAVSGDGPGNLV
ncbi:hypothetical protein G7Y89_g146 [Cudoniella acicularis]|uniref:SMODS and SLOG-associating 2TM effector domain-containing protein n=1 Tax=Cudoniella acicularis TaxID=354080 RepID=A0A8H4RYL5_9HELO|nr:hypothetical protein G7Y89_g146 [Cudoniella acicularis]